MTKPVKDFIGQELRVGDRVAYLRKERTDSGSIQKVMRQGTITDIYTMTSTFYDAITINNDFVLYDTDDIVKITNRGLWILDGEYKLVCNVCWKEALKNGEEHIHSEFCPHCGAEMGGETI